MLNRERVENYYSKLPNTIICSKTETVTVFQNILSKVFIHIFEDRVELSNCANFHFENYTIFTIGHYECLAEDTEENQQLYKQLNEEYEFQKELNFLKKYSIMIE